jgi:hypothetical protein
MPTQPRLLSLPTLPSLKPLQSLSLPSLKPLQSLSLPSLKPLQSWSLATFRPLQSLLPLLTSRPPPQTMPVIPTVISIQENAVFNDIMLGMAPTTNKLSDIHKTATYNPNIRPSGTFGVNNNVDSNGALYVNVELDLKQIVSLDEVSQILTTNLYLQVSWGDPRLSWNISTYDNVYYITAVASKVYIFIFFLNNFFPFEFQ